MQALCAIWGVLAALGMLVAFFPCLGALNWLNVPFALAGLVISAVTLTSARETSRSGAMAGVVLCGIASVLGILRLFLGGGVL
ncbi:MAG: hypothetical protein ACE15B_11965 [Bryobacteraceae bacterium]